ncbi:MAG: CpsD/CapB family tyrosine-protein kinase [Ethanoligenens sp.]
MALGQEKKAISHDVLLSSGNAPFQFIEAYKALRTNLQFFPIDAVCKKFLITSSIPGEGKSTVAINLAITLAESQKKVLLIDLDLRKPMVKNNLKIKDVRSGVSSILADQKSEDDCIVYLSDINLYVLTSGPIPPNPVELIGSDRMRRLIDRLEQKFDYILIDSPPVSVVTDAALASKLVHGVIFVLKQKYTSTDVALQAQNNLKKVNAKVVGCVFNAFDAKKSSKYAMGHYKYKDYADAYK